MALAQKSASASWFKSILLTLVILLGATLLVTSSSLLSQGTENRSKASSAPLPITGTFFLRLSAFLDSEHVVRQLLQEMEDTGIDTLIVGIGTTTKNGSQFFDYNELRTGMATIHVLRLAKQHNMKLYFALGTYSSASMEPWNDDPNDPNSNASHLINYSFELIDLLKQKTSEAGLSWSDPTIAGFYLWPEADIINFWSTENKAFRFLATMSDKVKERYPDKKILISPWMMESTDYATAKNAFTHVYANTHIDIIAPQDSMGTGKTQSITRNTEHFRALHDAVVAYPGKEAWANIEAFQSPQGDNGKFEPTTILKLQSQIASAKPYVSKLIMFSYQHSFLSDPAFDIFTTGSQTLSAPHDAARRKLLRQAYIETYANSSTAPLYYCDTQAFACKQTTVTYNPNHTQADNPSITCEQNLQSYLAGKTTGSCYATQTGCASECAPTQLMYYCDNTDNTCKQTVSNYYPISHREDKATAFCEDNLATYLPGKTTGACYASASTCSSNCPLPPAPKGVNMYYCDTRNYSCRQTTNTYNPTTQESYEGMYIPCSDNLNVYLPGITTGTCYTAQTSCESACVPAGVTPLPTMPTTTIAPTTPTQPTTPTSEPTVPISINTPTPTDTPTISPYTLKFVWLYWLEIQKPNMGNEGQSVTVYLSHENGNAVVKGTIHKEEEYDTIHIPRYAVPNLDLTKFYNVIVVPH